MKFRILFFALFSFAFVSGQNIYGNIFTEDGFPLADAIIFNKTKNVKTTSGNDGNFVITASKSDEIRFVKKDYQIKEMKISDENFGKPLQIFLEKIPIPIEEIKLVFKPSGDLKKDIKYFNPPPKVAQLNEDVRRAIKMEKNKQPEIKNKPNPLARDLNAGQVDLLKIAFGIVSLVKGKAVKNRKPNYAETQEFYKKIKENIDLNYFIDKGLDEFEFDIYLAKMNRKYRLAESFYKNPNYQEIETMLKSHLKKYIEKNTV